MDNLIEDEAEAESLLAKPACFIVVGRPVMFLSFSTHTHSLHIGVGRKMYVKMRDGPRQVKVKI